MAGLCPTQEMRGEVSTDIVWAEKVGWINAGDGTPANGTSYEDVDGSDFGVNIDPATGDLFGLAWGENIGWLNLDDSEHFVAVMQFPQISAWRRVAFHGGPVSDELAIELDPAATDGAVVSERRRCAIDEKSTTEVDSDKPIAEPLPSTIQEKDFTYPGHKADASSQQIISGGLTLEIEFAEGLPDEICWKIVWRLTSRLWSVIQTACSRRSWVTPITTRTPARSTWLSARA